MAKRVRKPEVTYKETETFELFPELEYTKAQKARLILFHAFNSNIKRIINYAANFDKPNCICMVYVVGEVAPEKIQALLSAADVSDRVCILIAAYPDESIKEWKAFDKFRESLKKSGRWDDETQNVNEVWQNAHKVGIHFKEMFEADRPDVEGQIGLEAFDFQYSPEWLAHTEAELKKDAETLEAIRRYHALAKKAPSCFRHWTLHRRGQEPQPFRHADTEKLIRRTYPLGVEAFGANPYAGLSPASAEAAVKLIMDGAENWRLGFKRDDMIQSAAARKIRKFVRDAIAESGYCSLFDLLDFVQSPPFGLTGNGYSAALLSAALAEENGLIFRDSVSDSDLQSNMYGLFLFMFSDFRRINSLQRLVRKDLKPHYLPCLYREYPCHKTIRKTLSDLYGVPDEWIGIGIVNRCREKMEGMFRLPLSMTDDLLYTLTSPDIAWYDRAAMEPLAAEVKARRKDFPRILAAHIAKNSAIPQVELIPGAACWLWERERLYDCAFCMATAAERETDRAAHHEAETLYMRKMDAMQRYNALRFDGKAETEEAAMLLEQAQKLGENENAINKQRYADEKNLRDVCRERLEALCGKCETL